MTIQKLKEAVRNLSPQDRILFVKYVLDTLVEDTDVKNNGEPLSDDWKEELEKRFSKDRYIGRSKSKTYPRQPKAERSFAPLGADTKSLAFV